MNMDILSYLNLNLEEITDIYLRAQDRYFYKQKGELKTGIWDLASYGVKKDVCELLHSCLLEWLSNKQKDELASGIEQNIGLKYENYRLRVHIFLSQLTPSINIRILPSHPKPSQIFEKLPLLHEILKYKSGLFLIAGPAGSTKSTQAAHILRYLAAKKAHHIICIEDPIEYHHASDLSLFTYREVGLDTKDFTSGILSALREDPDILFVGEIRAESELRGALLASQTGHLVVATIHGSDVANIILRFLSGLQNQIDSIDLAEALIGILLLRRDLPYIDFELTPITPALKTLIRDKKLAQIPSQCSFISQKFQARLWQ